MTTGDLREVIVRAAHTTARLGLVTAFGHVSARDGDTMVITPVAALGEIGPDGLLVVPVDVTELPTATPAEAWLHLQVYRRRPDVRAIVRGQPQETYAVGAVTDLVEPLHGQASWLGRRVPVHPGTRLLRSAELAAAAAESLGAEDAMVLRGNGAVATGATPGAAVARLWLLDMTCRIWTQAHRAGDPQPLDDDDVAAWRAAAPPLLERLWQHLADRTGAG